jgi:hypothetical protein
MFLGDQEEFLAQFIEEDIIDGQMDKGFRGSIVSAPRVF